MNSARTVGPATKVRRRSAWSQEVAASGRCAPRAVAVRKLPANPKKKPIWRPGPARLAKPGITPYPSWSARSGVRLDASVIAA